MHLTTLVVCVGLMAAVCTREANAKEEVSWILRRLRAAFSLDSKKLKGTRRGCSMYGHSCFGGYGKRRDASMGLGPSVGFVAQDLRDSSAVELPALVARGPMQVDDGSPEDVVLRQTPGSASARTPLWGRPSRLDVEGYGAVRGPGTGSGEDQGVDGDLYSSLGGRLLLRRWLRAYRQPAELGVA